MKKKILVLIMLLTMTVSFAGCQEEVSDYNGPWWPEAYANPAHTGTIDTTDFSMQENAWEYQFKNGYSRSTPVVVEGYFYVTCTDGYIYCFKDTKKPKVVWKYQTESNVTNSVIYRNGIIYAASNDGCVYALDAKKGDLIWFKSVNDPINFTPVVTNDAIILSTETTNTVYALSLDNGKNLWNYTVTSWIVTDMTYYDGGIDGGIVFFGCNDSYFYALNAKTGKILWKYYTHAIDIKTAAAFNDKVYFGGGSGTMYCFNVLNDSDVVTPVWTYECYNWISGAPAIKDGKIVFGSYDNYLYCCDAETGERLWYYQAPYWVTSGVTIVGNSVLFAASGNKDNKYYLYCIDFDTQKFRWVSNSSSIIRCAPSVVNGCVYYTNDGGKLIKLY